MRSKVDRGRWAGGGVLLALLLPGTTLAQAGRAIAIRGGTVLPFSGAPIPNGTVVMRGGKIVAVGARVEIPRA